MYRSPGLMYQHMDFEFGDGSRLHVQCRRERFIDGDFVCSTD
jgi:hypothetical protein